MTDIVERLREGVWGRARRADAVIQAAMQEGADEIERLLKARDAARREGIEAAIVACGAVSADTEGVWANGFTRGVIEAQASIRALLEDGR